MSIETIIAICVPVIALVFTALTFRRTSKKDTESDASDRAMMTADIKYIRTSIDDIKVDNRVIKQDIGTLQTAVAKVEQSVQAAHQRIDDFMTAKKG